MRALNQSNANETVRNVRYSITHIRASKMTSFLTIFDDFDFFDLVAYLIHYSNFSSGRPTKLTISSGILPDLGTGGSGGYPLAVG